MLELLFHVDQIKQTIVARSTSEANYVASSFCVTENTWLVRSFVESGIPFQKNAHYTQR